MTRTRRVSGSPHYNHSQRYTIKEHRNSTLKSRCKSKSQRVYLAQRNIKDFRRRGTAASFFCFVFLSAQKDEEKILNNF